MQVARRRIPPVLLPLHGYPLNAVDVTLSPYLTAPSYGIIISPPDPLVS